MASSDSDDDVPTEFEEALYRITAREMMGLTAILADIEELKGQMIKVRADSIYGEFWKLNLLNAFANQQIFDGNYDMF